MNQPLTKVEARKIIEFVGGTGQPPTYGFQFFSAGLGPYLQTIEEEYLASFVSDGGSAFKMVVGEYGGGKTHFLYSIRERAWKHNFVVSYIVLSPEHTPFHKLELVYQEIIRRVTRPQSPEELLSGYEEGISALIRSWFADRYSELERAGLDRDRLRQELEADLANLPTFDSISFTRAVKEAFLALMKNADGDFESIVQWLHGEGYIRPTHSRFGILQRIDKTTAFSMIRSLVQWVRSIGYSGLVVLMDEGERTSSMTSKQRELLLNNLRELIDECGHARFQNAFFVYAVPDENFLEGRAQIYEALKQRLETIFDIPNPAGVKIYLDKIWDDPIQHLNEIGRNLADIYNIAYDIDLHNLGAEDIIHRIASASYEQRFAAEGYKRFFVQHVIRAFGLLRAGKQVTSESLGLEGFNEAKSA